MEDAPRRLTAQRIEARATVLLLQCMGIFEFQSWPPVAVDEILERHLKFHLEFDELRKQGLDSVHGVTILNEKRVIIDERLDPVEYPSMEGRFNFTVAHEIGHIVLHHSSSSGFHFPTEGDLTRSRVGSYRELEWQADKFASYLLMPRHLIFPAWRSKFGSEQPLLITPEMEETARESGYSRAQFVGEFAELYADDFAKIFRVSNQAMRIRLQELGLLPR